MPASNTLKAVEGLSRFVKSVFKQNVLSMMGAVLARGALKKLNPERYNGASLLGLKGLVFKSHGGVKLCLSGHIHLLDCCEIDGITYICDGAVSANWWKGPIQGLSEGYGVVDLWAGMPNVQAGAYYSTSPPVVTRRLVIVGGTVLDNASVKEQSGVIRAYDVAPDGKTSNPRVHCEVKNPDGFKVDTAGRIWTSTDRGLSVFGADGKPAGHLDFEGMMTNCAFGGEDLKTLFVTAGGTLWSLECRSAGWPGAFAP